MSWDQLAAAATVSGTVIAAWLAYRQVRSDMRKRAAEDRAEKQKIHDDAFDDGKKSRDWEVAQIRGQRDDARQERDEARAENRELIRQNASLEAELRQRRGSGR